MEENALLYMVIEEVANRYHNGHFTIMQFTTNWRVSFGGQPNTREEIAAMPVGATLGEAFLKAVRTALRSED